MTEQEKIDFGVKKFLNEEGTLTEIRLQLKLVSTKPLSNRLEELGYHLYNGAKASSVKGLKLAVEEYINNYNDQPSITKIAAKYKIGRNVLSNRLKDLGYEIINHQNKLKFDETIFDSIDTEEKAYWLGFWYADGYLDSRPLNPKVKPKYGLEISLKGDDFKHLEKFNIFMKHSKNIVKISDVKCGTTICKRCRWGVTNKHLWQTLNNLGCTPRKSLIITFPNISIFKSPNLIRHFIRGYFDGDGCLSWCDKKHTNPHVSVLGTEDFLTSVKKYLPLKFNYILEKANKDSSNKITKQFSVCGKNGYELAKYLYSNATIYLERKYEKYLEYCRLYEKSDRLLETKIMEGCDANHEVNSESKESESPQRVEIEPEKSE